MTQFFRRVILAAGVALLPLGAAAQSDTYLAGVVQNPTVHVPPVQVIARYELPRMSGGANDFSGIATRDGTDIYLLSDHGFVVRGRLQRGYDGQIGGFDVRQVAVLSDPQGLPLGSAHRIAEGLSVAADGRLYVSFAEHNRVVTYPRLGAPAQAMGTHVDFERLRIGRGLEAVAVARDGSVYAIPEMAARATYGFPSYRWRNGDWEGSFRLPMEGQFLPVGAEFGPDGLLYVLERTGYGSSLRSQVRRFGINGRAISAPQVVMRSEPGQFGNLEGLAVFRDWNGRIRLLMVSDDDFGASGRSEIIDVVLNR